MFNVFPSFLGKIKEPLTFLDIGSASLKVIGLDSNLRIQKIGYAPVPEGEPELEDLPRSKEFLIIEGIRRFFLKDKFLSPTVYSVLSDRTVFTKVLRLFPMAPKETEKAVNYEAKLQVPFPIDKAKLSYFLLGRVVEKNLKKNEILLVTVPLDLIGNHAALFEKAELKLKVVDLSCFTFWRLFLANYPHLLNKTVALISMGASKSEINIIKKGNLCFSRIIPIGGQDFTRAIREELNIETAEAEAMKKEYGSAHRIIWGVEESKEETVERIYSCLSPLFSQFLNDLRRSLEFYSSQFSENPVDQIILTGGGSGFREIEEFISENLNRIPVEKFRLKQELEWSASVDKESREILKNQEILQQFTSVLGLLSWNSAKAKINLAGAPTVKEAQSKKGFSWEVLDSDPVLKWLVISGALLFLGIICSSFFMSRMEKKYSLQLKKQQEQASSLEQKKASFNPADQQKNTAVAEILRSILADNKQPINEMVEAISRSISGQVFLSQINFDYLLKQVEINGRSVDSEAVNNFLEGLNQEGKFSRITLMFIKEEPGNQKFKKSFKISGEF